MKSRVKNPHLMFVLFTGTLLIPAGLGKAQTLVPVYEFSAPEYPATTNSDGIAPDGLVLSGNHLYGTAHNGGTAGNGTVFAVNADGTDFTNLHSFSPDPLNNNYAEANSDGANPYGLVLSGNRLYGTTEVGGAWGNGTVFAMNTDGTGFTNLHSFTAQFGTNSDGAFPLAGLLLSGNRLYGTTDAGGSAGLGTIFALNTDGSSFTNLHSFVEGEGGGSEGALIIAGGILYGTTPFGGSNADGSVFAVSTNGADFTNLYSFSALSAYTDTNGYTFATNSDGAQPEGGLVLAGGTLYGTTPRGGAFANGTVFALRTDGSVFANLHTFTAFVESTNLFELIQTNNDGAMPTAGLVLAGGRLYGTASVGGFGAVGTVFAVNSDGSGFTNLYDFTGGNDGGNPGALISGGNFLYGATGFGAPLSNGLTADGAVFSLSLPSVNTALLNISRSGANMILSWPSNAASFLLQTNGDLTTTNWADYTTSISTNGSTESVTVVPSAGNLFFRLARP